MAQLDREQERHTFSNHSSPTRETELPLVLDEDQIDDDMDDDEDLAADLVRYRVQAARTLFHQPRSESDTLQVLNI
ncbi:hypothetical protein ONS95_013023 [Cadophora gregata]|uniref:uncharacterized protein n=1 Tax=Cadophora gregata TaxID=51156 RepID=UPI0026DCBB9C|nr:uncharacterized protein ONS95_013023 [Cadophora gregata]KAK0115984.1 hypothetical protein ONS95_013023 [Cadophora gregata]